MNTYKQSKTHTQPAVILFVHYGDEWIRGSERCLLDLINTIDKKKFLPIVWCNSKTLKNELKKINITCISSKFNILFGWTAPRFHITSWLKLIFDGVKLIHEFNVDLIHTNSAAPNQWMIPAARLTKRSLISQIHSPYIFRDRLLLGTYFTPKMIAVSQYVAEPFLNDGRCPDETHIVYNGIDIQKFEKEPLVKIHDHARINTQDFIITCVGSLIKRKGVDLVLDVFHTFSHNKNDVKLVIVGDGEEREALERQTERLNIKNNVIFLGECDYVADILTSGTHLLISGAREEAFGLVFAEAGAAKLPVIAPNIDGIPEVVINNETGILYPKEDTLACKNALNYFYNHREECVRMGNNGYQRTKKLFTIKNNANIISQLYIDAINSKKISSRTDWKRLLKVIRHKLFSRHTATHLTYEKKDVLINNRRENDHAL